MRNRVGRCAIFVILAGVTACSASYSELMGKLTPAQLRAARTDDLCVAYAQGQGGAAMAAELLRRGALFPGEPAAVQEGQVRVGMSRCAVLAVLGEPVTVTATAVSATLAFSGERFVTFEDGKVVEISR